jgi:Arc/MetJ-type ribon-helix-helix transcriptional regulator
LNDQQGDEHFGFPSLEDSKMQGVERRFSIAASDIFCSSDFEPGGSIMAKTGTLTIDIPTELLAQIRGAVQSGDYISDEEIVSEALQDWGAKHGAGFVEDIEWLRQAIKEADEDEGPGVPMEEVMDGLEAKYRALAAERSGSV